MNNSDDIQDRPDLSEVLIEDRELAPADPDRFRHEDLIEQLADLAVNIEPPANVALYGPWGSGKSSIASHLQAELDQREAPVRFARYDAFKYARLPLQRHFIRHLASTLEVTDRKYDKGLYEDTTSNDITLGSPEDGDTSRLLGLLRQTLIVLGAALAAAVLLTAVAAFIGSWASRDDGFGDNLSAYLRTYTIGFLAPAGVLAVFGALAGRKLNVVRGTSAPTSEEQFASTFSDLVADSLKKPRNGIKCNRVVVFIDELDRCDPGTVVATLESLRSFLDADKCIFIVAADQQVLEAALTTHVRHAVPRDTWNPYYSAGSEYLDKTFHYQLAIPPLLPRRLSGFAADLVRGKQGVWAEVGSVERVVSVLIPNHVRSPRRAKTLLNSFALHYELADRRCKVGHLAGTPAERAEEIAVLTCLRVEFPLFARDLRQHPKLVDAARRMLQGEDHPPSIPESTWNACHEFLEGERPIDVALHDETATAGSETRVLGDGAARPDLMRAQADHLKSYLRKTGYVRGPSRDLIHLESSGARFGLDPVDADELEDAASQADTDLVAEILLRLGDQRVNGMLSLAESLDRDVPPLGHEADNLISVVLSLYEGSLSADSGLEPDDMVGVRGRFSTAVDAHTRTYDLRENDLPGALALGLDSDTESGHRLVDTVLSHEESIGHLQLTVIAIRYFAQLHSKHPDALSALTAKGLQESSMRVEVADALKSLPVEQGSLLLERIELPLAEHLRSILAVAEVDPESAQAGVTADADDPAEADVAADLKRESLELLDAFLDVPPLMQRIAASLLAVDHVEALNAVGTYLPDLVGAGSVVQYPKLGALLVEVARRRVWKSVPRWLGPVDESMLDEPTRMAAADHLATGCWKAVTSEDDVDPELLKDTLHHIRRLQTEPLGEESFLKASVDEAVDSPVSDAQAEDGLDKLSLLETFVTATIIDPAVTAEIIGAAAIASLTAGIQPAALATGGLQRWLIKVCQQTAKSSSPDSCTALLAALESSQWMPTPGRERAQLLTSAAAAARGLAVESPYGSENVSALVAAHGESLDAEAAQWLNAYSPPPIEAAPVIDQIFQRRPSAEVLSALGGYVGSVAQDQRGALVKPEIDRCLDEDPRTDLLRVMKIDEANESEIASSLVDVFKRATNMEHRRRLLDVWTEAKIVDSSARATLINDVLLPTGQSGIGGIDLVIRNVDLWRDPPHGTKGALRDLRKLASSEQRSRMTHALVVAGLVREEKGFFGFGPTNLKDVD